MCTLYFFFKFFLQSLVCQQCKLFTVGNLIRNSQLVKNKNRENTRQRKTITRTRQYLRDSTICLRPRSCRDFTIIREKYKCSSTMFQSLKNNNKTLITKAAFSTSRRPKPPLHALSLRKSPIKNHARLFGSGQVVNRIKHNQAPQNPTFTTYAFSVSELMIGTKLIAN